VVESEQVKFRWLQDPRQMNAENLKQWFPTSGRDPNLGRGGCDAGSRDGFIENSIIMKKNSKFVSKNKQNARENVIHESVFIYFKHRGEIKF
jgi:hypothetical protein